MDRTDLLNRIYVSRTRLEAALNKLNDQQMLQPGLPGGWTVKDMLAHIGWWEQRVVNIYQWMIGRGEIPWSADENDNVDEVNIRVYEQYQNVSLEEVRAFERQAFHDLLAIVETAPEEDIFETGRFDYLEDKTFHDLVVWNSYDHYDEHLETMQPLLSEPKTVSGQEGVGKKPAQHSAVVQRAGEFIHRVGREIEQAEFDFHFGSLPLDDLMAVLAKYQNEDGGFFGLEVDIKAPQSNPFATELALVVMRWADVPRDHPLLRRTVDYLEQTQHEDGTWQFTKEIYDHQLPPWFQGWKWPNLNPSCTIAGLLKELGLGSDRLHTRVQRLFDRIANPADLVGDEYYNVRPYAYYFQTEWNFDTAEFYRWGVVWWMTRQHMHNPGLDATHFLDFAPTPESPIARRLPDAVLRAKLDGMLSEQIADGGWPTPYDQGWRGWNTLLNLLILRAHGRL
jgi:hypothetical protein